VSDSDTKPATGNNPRRVFLLQKAIVKMLGFWYNNLKDFEAQTEGNKKPLKAAIVEAGS